MWHQFFLEKVKSAEFYADFEILNKLQKRACRPRQKSERRMEFFYLLLQGAKVYCLTNCSCKFFKNFSYFFDTFQLAPSNEDGFVMCSKI